MNENIHTEDRPEKAIEKAQPEQDNNKMAGNTDGTQAATEPQPEQVQEVATETTADATAPAQEGPKRTAVEWAKYHFRQKLHVIPTILKARLESGYPQSLKEIDAIWKKYPNAQPAILLGKYCNYWVLDVDAPYVTATGKPKHEADGRKTLAELEEVFGPLPETKTVQTPSGGLHKYFLQPLDGTTIGCPQVNRFLPCIDVKGQGGYVMAEGAVMDASPDTCAGEYKLINDVPAVFAPQWLVDLATGKIRYKFKSEREAEAEAIKKEMAGTEINIPPDSPDGMTADRAWGLASLNGCCADLTAALNQKDGSRNNDLNRYAFKIGQLVPRYLNEDEALDAIRHAVQGTIYERDERPGQIKATIASGFYDGMTHPRYRQEKQPAPASTGTPSAGTGSKPKSKKPVFKKEQWSYAEMTAEEYNKADEDTQRRFIEKPKKMINGDIVPGNFWVEPGSNILKVLDTKADWPAIHLIPVCDGSLFVRSFGRDKGAQSIDWSMKLSWKDRDGKEVDHILRQEMIGIRDLSQLARPLLSKGLQISRTQLSNFAQYLSEYKTNNRYLTSRQGGWYEAGGEWGYTLPDKCLPTNNKTQCYLIDAPEQNPFETCGTLKDWQDTIGTWALNNDLLILVISLAFSGLCSSLTPGETTGIHLYGDSSTGKTTLTCAAASVVGVADKEAKNSVIQTYEATGNALENIAALHNDSLLCLDEISQAASNSLSATIYALGNGQQKKRLRQDATLRAPLCWKLAILSNGEVTIGERLLECGVKVKAGQEMRFLDVPADAGTGKGCFRDLHGHADGAEFSKAIKKAARLNYGVARDAFILYAAANMEALGKTFLTVRDQVMEQIKLSYAGKEFSGQAQRAAEKFAMIAGAGEAAIASGVLPWPAGTAINAIADPGGIFEKWATGRGGTGQKEDRDTLFFFSSRIAQNPGYFEDLSHNPDGKDDVHLPFTSSVRWGFRETDYVPGEGAVEVRYLFTKDMFKAFCEMGGISPERALQHLKKAGWLQSTDERKRLPGIGQQRCRVIRMPENGKAVVYKLDGAPAEEA